MVLERRYFIGILLTLQSLLKSVALSIPNLERPLAAQCLKWASEAIILL